MALLAQTTPKNGPVGPTPMAQRAHMVMVRNADAAVRMVGMGKWLLWDEVTETSTREVRATRRAKIGGLTVAL
jgi:hypothetical protein